VAEEHRQHPTTFLGYSFKAKRVSCCYLCCSSNNGSWSL